MAGQLEESVFEPEIYQIETADPVEGGIGGVTNLPLLQLANRTLWLKNRITELQAADVTLAAADAAIIAAYQAADAVLQGQINNILPFIPKKRGFVTGINLPETSGSLSVGGDVLSAVGSANGILVTLNGSMPSVNYKVNIAVESLGTQNQDGQTAQVMFKKVSSTQFYIVMLETGNATQNLKVHLDVISL